MKNLKSFLVMLFVVYAMHAYTAVLIVNENGLGGAYTTISAALAAASSGDRILVYPKADGAYYNESPFVSLKNIDLLNAIEGQKFKVSGNISLDSGCVISGADVIGIIFDGGGVNSNVHIINCKILYGGIFASGESTKTFVENDSIINGSIRIYKGRVSGCHVSGNTGPNGAIELSNSSGVPVSNDTAFIVGNKIEISANQFNGPQIGIRCISPKVFSYVSNNYITLASNNSSIAVFGIYIEVIKSDPNIRNLIINNTVREIGPYSQASYGFVHVSGPLMGIYNNISSSTGTGYGYGFYGGNQTEMDFKYNYSHNSPVAFYNMPSHVCLPTHRPWLLR